jgi:hypothetical protein
MQPAMLGSHLSSAIRELPGRIRKDRFKQWHRPMPSFIPITVLDKAMN